MPPNPDRPLCKRTFGAPSDRIRPPGLVGDADPIRHDGQDGPFSVSKGMLRMTARICIALLASIVLAGCRQAPTGRPAATLLITGGTIHTMDDDRPRAEAMAIAGNRILYVGDLDNAVRYAGPETERIDLRGGAAFPGFTDAHAHLVNLGRSLSQLDLVGTESFDAVCDAVAGATRERPLGSWILGRGWDQNDWPVAKFPSHEALSAASPDHPVLLTRIDGHAVLANRKAMEIAGIDAVDADPEGGKILRDEQGRATGVFIDTASGLLKRHVPAPGRDELRRAARLAIDECHRLGLVGIHDAGVDTPTLEVYEAMIREGVFDFRLYAMLSATMPDLGEALGRGPRVGLGDHRLTVRCVKVYADGALGSRGAALLTGYSDEPDHRGLVITPREAIERITLDCLTSGFQVATHAIGDRGNRLVLDAYEDALDSTPHRDPRLRIEHAQVVHLDDIPRFAELGVLPSMQPTHCTSDMDWATDRLGPDRVRGAYAWRLLLDDGNRIPCGSDFPVERVDPLLGVYAAVTRQHPDGTPPGGWQPDQRMTREEVVRGFTIDAAYAAFEERSRGTLTPGKLADVTVFDRDILTCAKQEILEARAMMTIVDGRIVHDARAAAKR